MAGGNVLEKTNRINLLFDYYGELLTAKQQTFMKTYFQDNYSLGEISLEFNISRQAVFEHIKRAEYMLDEYESKLNLLSKHEQRLSHSAELERILEQYPVGQNKEIRDYLHKIVSID